MHSESPLISVVIPVYNAEKYIDDAINSIVTQTYKNIEIIVIDDSSTDNSYAKLEKWQALDDRIRLYRNDKNSKIVKTLNRGFGLARGEYIARMDADDISVNVRFEKQMQFMKDNPIYGLVGCSLITIDKNGNKLGRQFMPTDIDINRLLLIGTPVPHPTWMIRKSVVQKIGLYRNDTAEDYDYILRLKTNNIAFTNINDCLLYYRISESNTANTQGLKQIKAKIYAKKLYLQRTQVGSDNYSDENYYKNTNSSLLMVYLHNKSQYVLNKAWTSSNYIKKIMFAVFSVSLSYYSLFDLIDRFRWKYSMRQK